MPNARRVLHCAGVQTQRLLIDLATPAVAWWRRPAAAHEPQQTSHISAWSRSAALAVILCVAVATLPAAWLILWSSDHRLAAGERGPGNASSTQPPAAVRILDAKPRGASCEEQVWPYFEHHCLRRAPADRQGRVSAPDAETPGSASQGGRSAGRVAAPWGATPSPDADHDTRLQAPTGARSGESEGVALDTNGAAAVPRGSRQPPAADGVTVGAGMAAGLAAWQLSERSRQAEPRRRSARRAERRRGRPPFPLFILRF
jgi:hypothetical protein